MQLIAGIRKEWLELVRTKRIVVMALGMMVFSILNPLMLKSLPYIIDFTTSQLEQADSVSSVGPAIESQINGGLESGQEGNAASVFESDNAQSVGNYLATAADLGLLAILLALMRTAGGDQKNKSCVIPLCLGYKRKTYVYAKYAVYAPAAAVITVVFFFVAYGFSSLLFPDGTLPLQRVWIPLAALVLFIVYNVCLMLAIGCITGRAGISALCIYMFNTFVIFFVASVDIAHYHPYGLSNFYYPVAGAFPENYIRDFAVTGGITMVLAIVLCFLAAYIFNRKRLI